MQKNILYKFTKKYDIIFILIFQYNTILIKMIKHKIYSVFTYNIYI